MKTIRLETEVKAYAYDELSDEDRRLVDEAKRMTATSYAPYSRFHVGAAILMADGSVATGSNQENAAYPASAVKPGVAMKKIAVAAWTGGRFQGRPISPCGACRQVLAEYEKLYGPIEVLLYGEECVYVLPSVASLLPLTFTEF